MQQQHKTGMTNAERANLARNSPGIFGRSGNSPSTGSAGIAILLFSLTGIIFLFLLFYFLSRLCTTKPMTVLDERSTVRKGLYKFNTMALHQYSPQTVLYPKRIYELQAEEGLFSGLPQLSLTHESSVLGSASLINPILSMIDFEGKEQWLRSIFQRTQEIEATENDHGNKLSYPYGKVSVAAQTALQCGRQLVRKLTGIDLDDVPVEKKVEQIITSQPHAYSNPEFVKS
uniref:Uncharacterized protein n=1 Tax=Ditylenchus dipsaci TaxID=166011 RepID=A0A915D8Z3_9BILA